MNAKMLRVGIALTTAAACADDSYQVRTSQELAAGTITVEVRPEGEPLAGVPVLIHDRSGALFAEVATDAYGTVQTEIPDDAQVTVLVELAQHTKKWAAQTLGVHPGAALVIDSLPHAPYEHGGEPPLGAPFQLKLAPYEPPTGGRTSNYYIEERSAHVHAYTYELDLLRTDFGPYTRRQLARDPYGSPRTIGVLAYARAGELFPPFIDVPVVGYSFGELAAGAPAGTVLEMPPFRTDFHTVTVEEAPGGTDWSRAVVTGYQGDTRYPLAEEFLDSSVSTAAIAVPRVGALQSLRLCGQSGVHMRCRVEYATELPDQAPITLPPALPFDHLSMHMLEEGPVVWSPPALTDAGADEVLVFEARWWKQHFTSTVTWTVASAADAVGPFQLPSLPAAYATAYYPFEALDTEVLFTRASSSVQDRATSLAHFATWVGLQRSTYEGGYRQQSVERLPGAQAGDSASLTYLSRELPHAP